MDPARRFWLTSVVYVSGWPLLATIVMVWWTYTCVPVSMSGSLVRMVFATIAVVDVLGIVMLYPDSPFRWFGTLIILLVLTVAQWTLILGSFFIVMLFCGP